jgi:hypothetical protein
LFTDMCRALEARPEGNFVFVDEAQRVPSIFDAVNADPGRLFKDWAGCQPWRRLSYERSGTLSCYRTSDGAEVDFIVENHDETLPIEVKWTESPTIRDVRHLRSFIREHAPHCKRGIIISRCPHTLAL